MSIRVMSAVWEHSEAEGIELLVLLAIADCASDDGGHAWPSIQTLAIKTRVSVRTVQRAIRTLEARGEIVVKLNAGMRGANVYRVVVRPRQADTPQPPEAASTPASVTPPDDNLTPVRESPGVTGVTPSGDKGVTRTVLNHQPTPQPPASGGPIAAHCQRHSKNRKGCEHCCQAEADRLAKAREAERRRTETVFAEIEQAKAQAVRRPAFASSARELTEGATE